MKFPKFPSLSARPKQPSQELEEKQKDQSTGSAWSTALLMIGSALVGATAVAVLNRRTITEMRSHLALNSGREPLVSMEDPATGADEIF